MAGPPRADWGSRDAATAAYWAQRTAGYHGVVTWSPTIDPEALKTLSMQMTNDAKVRLLFHAWAAAPIVDQFAVATLEEAALLPDVAVPITW